MRYLRLYHIILRLHVHVKCVTKLYCICLLGLCGRIQCDNNPLAELRNVRVEMFLTGRSHVCCRMTTAASILAFVGAAVPWLWRGRRTQENHGHSQS